MGFGCEIYVNKLGHSGPKILWGFKGYALRQVRLFQTVPQGLKFNVLCLYNTLAQARIMTAKFKWRDVRQKNSRAR